MTTHRVPTVFSQELHQFYINSLQVLVVICIGITSFRGYIQQAYMCPGSLAITFRNRSSYNQSISSPPPPPIQDTQHYQATVISSRSSNTSPTSICHLKGRMLFTGITRNSMESRFPGKPHSIINLEHSILLGILRLDIRSIPPAPPQTTSAQTHYDIAACVRNRRNTPRKTGYMRPNQFPQFSANIQPIIFIQDPLKTHKETLLDSIIA